MASRALVVGGNGFIGSHLVDLLVRDQPVTVLDAHPKRDDVVWPDVTYIQGTLHDPAALDAALEGVSQVYHLASTTVPSTSNDDPIADVEGNLVGTLGLLSAMRSRGVERIVYFSSGGTVYGNPEVLPVPETAALKPLCSYGVVKVAIERYLLMYEALGRVSPVILRPGNPYGPRQRGAGQGLVAAVMQKALAGSPVDVWGDGSVVRDYLYIEDLVRLAQIAMESGCTGAFNAGSGSGTSILEIIRGVEAVSGRRLRVVHHPERGFDVQALVLDGHRTAGILGWTAATSMSDGIRMTWEWMEKEHHGRH